MKVVKYLLPPILCTSILLLIFFIKDVFPFGSNNVIYADMGQLFVPMYTYLWDVLHGVKSIFFDWSSAGGTNMIAMSSVVGFINPVNLFFYFVPRDNILEYMSIFLLLKMILIVCSMSWYLNIKYKNLPIFWHVILTLLYAFNGYVLQYYTNINWLDLVYLFPLLILSIDRLLIKGKNIVYILIYAFCLMFNIQLIFAVTVFIILYAGIYIYRIVPKYRRKEKIINFCISSCIAVVISLGLNLPAIYQIFSGMRFQHFFSLFEKNLYTDGIFNKFFILLGLELPIAMILSISAKKGKKYYWLLALCILMFIPLIFERVNLILHGGSYVCFSGRYAFIIAFVVINFAAYLVVHCKSIRKKDIFKIISIIGIIGIIGITSFVFDKVHWQSLVLSQTPKWEFIFFIFFIVFNFIVYFFILKIKNQLFMKILLIIMLAVEILFVSNGFIAAKKDDIIVEICPEHSEAYIVDARRIRNNIGNLGNEINRLKCKDFTLNTNYSFILGNFTFANWTNMIHENVFIMNRELGYFQNYTYLMDFGGTVFSDALLNYKYVLSLAEQDSMLYKKIAEDDEVKLYQSKVSLPFGIILNNDDIEVNIDTNIDININKKSNNNLFELQNDIYKIILGEEKELFEIKNISIKENKFYIEDKSIVYLYNSNDSYTDYTYNINGNVFGEIIENSSAQIAYGGIVELGIFENQEVNLQIINDNIESVEGLIIGIVKVNTLLEMNDKIEEVAQNIKIGTNCISMEITSDKEDSILFLPIPYDLGWKFTVNGEVKNITPFLECFIGIPLQYGENIIEMTFVPYGFKLGNILSICGIICFIIWYFYSKKIVKNKVIQKIGIYIFNILLVLLIFVIYVLPTIYSIIIFFF